MDRGSRAGRRKDIPAATRESARSFEHWLAQWGEYRIEAERFEDHGDQVFVAAREYAQGKGSGAATEATIYAVLTFRDSKVIRYREFYDEAAARASIG